MLQGINISKSYGNKQVLKMITIKIEKGKATVVMGPSGSGKTTLLRNLSLLDRPDSGKVVIDDQELIFPNDNIFKKPYPKVTVVYQQLFLWPHLTNRENITLAVESGDYKKQLNELISYLGMTKFIDNYPNQSSVGQKQRVAIARALILNPEYIFFDEITSALDTKQIETIIKIINDLKNKNIGIFFITHHNHVAKKIGDSVIHLKETE